MQNLSHYLKNQTVKAESQTDQLLEFIKKNNINTSYLARVYVDKIGTDKNFYGSATRFRKLANSCDKDLAKIKLLTDYLYDNKVGPRVIDGILTMEKDSKYGQYTPLDIVESFALAGVTFKHIKPEKEEDLWGSIEFKYRTQTLVEKLNSGYPVGTNELTEFARMVFNNSQVFVVPYDDYVLKATMFIVDSCVLKMDDKGEKKEFVLKNCKDVASVIGVHSRMFTEGAWNVEFVDLLLYFTSDQAQDMDAIKRKGVSVSASQIYKSVYATFAREDNRKLCVNYVKKFLLPPDAIVPTATIQPYGNAGLLGALKYLEKRRTVFGRDKKLGSEITRNAYIGACLPGPVSTAQKYKDVVNAIPKGVYDKVIVAGCAPGHFMPLMKKNLAKFEVPVESQNILTGEMESISNISYIDIKKCNRADAYSWKSGDVRTQVLGESTLLISDAWPNKTEGYEFTASLCTALYCYQLGCTLTEVGGTLMRRTGTLAHYAVKILMAYNPNLKREVARGVAPQNLQSYIKKLLKTNAAVAKNIKKAAHNAQTPEDAKKYKLSYHGLVEIEMPYLTKIGRPHNAEFMLSSFVINKKSKKISTEKMLCEYCTKHGDLMLNANMARALMPFKNAKNGYVKVDGLDHDENPLMATVTKTEIATTEEMAALVSRLRFVDAEMDDVPDVKMLQFGKNLQPMAVQNVYGDEEKLPRNNAVGQAPMQMAQLGERLSDSEDEEEGEMKITLD